MLAAPTALALPVRTRPAIVSNNSGYQLGPPGDGADAEVVSTSGTCYFLFVAGGGTGVRSPGLRPHTRIIADNSALVCRLVVTQATVGRPPVVASWADEGGDGLVVLPGPGVRSVIVGVLRSSMVRVVARWVQR